MRYPSDPRALARKHLERRLAPLRAADLSRPPRGWIRALRDSLGMTAAQLAARIGVSQPRIAVLEKAEASGNVTLASLREAAEGLGCTFVYALVPNAPLDDMLRARAGAAADLQLTRTHQTMMLENQALEPAELRAERERLVEEMLRGDLRRLWDTP